MIKHHLKHMALGVAVILGLLLAFGVDLSTAFRYALLLACPLGMAAMMLFMGRGRDRSHGHQGSHDHRGHERVAANAGGENRPTRDEHEPIA
ncbi:hypothetical protein MHY85_02030 [Cellulomonas sp. ACRRI]|uniref:hypothetical protein n=1 Tax=Cellulomonas sp. ACRRI TaxID=2918188 RepID=UPI001EF284A0|nr:hypothetical protein [Cellulomonas sp. ACRRI]MCG7284750.1 hypothetical protein [Cellulomonas sp. ACRRI]